jgi:hypothetical protein
MPCTIGLVRAGESMLAGPLPRFSGFETALVPVHPTIKGAQTRGWASSSVLVESRRLRVASCIIWPWWLVTRPAIWNTIGCDKTRYGSSSWITPAPSGLSLTSSTSGCWRICRRLGPSLCRPPPPHKNKRQPARSSHSFEVEPSRRLSRSLTSPFGVGPMVTILTILLIILLGAALPTFPYRMQRQSAPAPRNGHTTSLDHEPLPGTFVNTSRVHRTWSDRLKMWRCAYETKIYDRHREVTGRGFSPEASQNAAERRWVKERELRPVGVS